jgi:hypothetical protein
VFYFGAAKVKVFVDISFFIFTKPTKQAKLVSIRKVANRLLSNASCGYPKP